MFGVLMASALAFSAAPAVTATTDVDRIEIAFEVDNVNRSALPCQSNGISYRVRGELIGPAAVLRRTKVPVATLYLHEFSFGRFFWRFDEVPGYDHATQLAKAGHVSFVVDRLGYDASDHPPGSAVCLGSHADVVAQLVRHIRQGTYTTTAGGPAVPVERVVLAGHSVGGGIAELTAHSPAFADLDLAGLILFGWADQGYSSRTIEQSVRQGADCLPSGEPAYPGGPPRYAYFGKTDAEFQGNVFADTDPVVVERVTARRNRDPCGDNATLVRFAVMNQLGVGSITAPILLVFGEKDAVFQSDAMAKQAALFDGSTDVTTHSIPKAGHALTLERSAPLTRSVVSDWLTDRGLVTVASAPGPQGNVDPGPAPDVDAGAGAGADRSASAVLPTAVLAEHDEPELPATGGEPSRALPIVVAAAALLAYVRSRARRSTSSTIGTISDGGLLPRKARNSGTAAAGSFLSSKRIMPLKKRASG
jgi:pimeloyl-ACP methyl ester carboxylesterase